MMTLQELFRTVWFGRWLVLTAVVAAVAGGWFYLAQQMPVYGSQANVQLVDAATITSAGLRIDTDPSLVSSAEVAAAAATALGDSSRADAVASSVTGEYAASDPNSVSISASGSEPADVVATANAVATAYVASLQSEFNRAVASMQSRLDDLGASITQSQAAVNASRSSVNGAQTDGLLEAQYTASIAQYQTLSTQVAAAQLLAAPGAVRQNAVSAQLASIPPELVYLISLFAGLLVGVGLAVGRRSLDTKVRTAGGVRRASGAPVLARLSGTAVAQRTAERTGDLPVAIRTATSYTQSVRELRTTLQAAVDRGPGAVIVVTAADLEAPRSFIAANLAASWALSGRSVIALSGDLRQPRLNALLLGSPPVARREGDLGARTGSAAADQPIPTSIPHLHVYPALRTELDPADYLASDDVRDLIERLRATADVVIIDAPPMLVAADATIIGAYSDGVLVVATIGQTEILALEESAERLRGANARLLGVVLDGGGEHRRSTYAATYTFTGETSGGDGDTRLGQLPGSVSESSGTVLLDNS